MNFLPLIKGGGGGAYWREGAYLTGGLYRGFTLLVFHVVKWSWQSRFLRCINFTAGCIVINCL